MQCVTRLVVRTSQCHHVTSRCYHVSAPVSAGSKWRLQQGLGKYGNEYGPLTDIPDWSYADGRPSPIQPGEKLRRERQKEFAKKALGYMGEMRDSKQIHKEKQRTRSEARQRLLEQKLKPKQTQR